MIYGGKNPLLKRLFRSRWVTLDHDELRVNRSSTIPLGGDRLCIGDVA